MASKTLQYEEAEFATPKDLDISEPITHDASSSKSYPYPPPKDVDISSTFCYDCNCDPVDLGKRICCTRYTAIFFIATLVHLIPLLCLWCLKIQPNLDARARYEPGQCSALSYKVVPFRCCQLEACSCVECNLMQPNCASSSLIAQASNRSTCCGNGCCAQTYCSTCCDLKCDSDGKNCHNVCYQCNCYCSKPVSHDTCGFSCGTCRTIGVTFQLSVSPSPRLYTTQFECGQDNLACEASVWVKYGTAGNSWPCWYDPANPNALPRFDGIPGLAVTAIVFFALFLATWVISAIVWMVFTWKEY